MLHSFHCRRCGQYRPLEAFYRNSSYRLTVVRLTCCGASKLVMLDDDIAYDDRIRGLALSWSAGDPWTWLDSLRITHAIDVRIGRLFFARCDGMERRERTRSAQGAPVRDDGLISCLACLGAS